MGIFDNTENDNGEEVRINISERGSKGSKSKSRGSRSSRSRSGKLRNEVSSELTGGSKGTEASLDDIHEQNEKIIELLKEIKAKEFNRGSKGNNMGNSSGNRVTDRRTQNDRNDGNQDNNDMAGGLDGVL